MVAWGKSAVRAARPVRGFGKSIGVLVVDDSALIREILKRIIGMQHDMQVLGTARDPLIAREMVRDLKPDVITLDVEMPRMDGLDFLEEVMREQPTGVLMVSSRTLHGAETTLRALELGAVDFVAKPAIGISEGMDALSKELVEKIRAAAMARPKRTALPVGSLGPAAPKRVVVARRPRSGTEKLVAIGASTGGTEAIREVLQALPALGPAIVITQHMPPGFTASFAKRLDSLCRIRVKEAEHGERLLPGHAYIAPGDRHLQVGRSGADYIAQLSDAPPVNRHRPSVDVLFESVAREVGPNALGIILTGMGRDGARGMRQMHEAGARTLAQDEASCVVYGMPKEAVALGGVDESMPLSRIAPRVLEIFAREGGAGNRV